MEPNLPGLPTREVVPPPELERALAAKGPGYEPRTVHRRPDGSPAYTNRLILETSPYLLQHAHNPVSWYAWGDEPFARARREAKLVFLSIGYSTCHWCHVMERESFEDVEVATFLNEHYVAIKVDREERPDVDSIYMAAVQLLTGGGGWPMTVVLTPEREPVFAGTYFPAKTGDRGFGIGLLAILRELQRAWAHEPAAVTQIARQQMESVRLALAPAPPAGVPGAEAIRGAVARLLGDFDRRGGGFGGAPKFPQPMALELLARFHRRTGDAAALEAALRTLECMAAGGIHDQVGGGFHRYAVDAEWRVPHFEKMLYDNAQLAMAYLELYQITGRGDLVQVVRSTLNYVAREMTHDAGAFFSATDADSAAPDGSMEEGRFFTWTWSELQQAMGSLGARAAALRWGVTPGGSLGERTVLRVVRPVEEVASGLGVPPEEANRLIEQARRELFRHRGARPPPLCDEKVITAWNGLMISAFARTGFAMDEAGYVARAARAASFLLERSLVGGRLRRTYHAGEARHPGCLEDYACVIQALLDLYEASGARHWLRRALDLQAVLDEELWDGEGGGYFLTAAGGLPVREKSSYDVAEPSGNSVAALSLLRLEQLTGDAAYRRRAEGVLAAHASGLARGVGLPKMLAALDYYTDRPLQIAVVVAGDAGEASALLAPLRRAFLPNRALVVVREQEVPATARLVPWLEGKATRDGRACAYVCRAGVCDEPVTDPEALRRQLAAVEPLPDGGSPPGSR